MELPANIRLIFVPRWVRVLIGLLLAGVAVWNIFLVLQGLREPGTPFVESAVSLMASVLPFVVGALVLSFAEGGVGRLQRNTDTILGELLPRTLARIPEMMPGPDQPRGAELRPFQGGERPPPTPPSSQARIELTSREGQCQAHYLIHAYHPKVGDTLIRLRVELNVQRANIVLFFPTSQIDEMRRVEREKPLSAYRDEQDLQTEVARFILSLFPGTTFGARFPTSSDAAESGTVESYAFTPASTLEFFHGERTWNWAAYRTLDPDFLWAPSKQLFFCQDLLFMVRAFWNERPELFAVANGPAHPLAAQEEAPAAAAAISRNNS